MYREREVTMRSKPLTLLACATLLALAAVSSALAQQPGGDWLPLGNYTLLNETGRPTARFLQLNMTPEGKLRGVLYDRVNDTAEQLRGRIDSTTQQVQWRFNSNPQVTFRTSLPDLTQPMGVVELTQPGGQRTRWRIARQDF